MDKLAIRYKNVTPNTSSSENLAIWLSICVVWNGGDSDEDDEYCGEVWDCGGEGEEGMDFFFFLFFWRGLIMKVTFFFRIEMSRKTSYHHRTMFWWFGRSQGCSESQRILWQKPQPQQQQRQLIIFPRRHPLLRNTLSRRTRHVPSRITRCCSGRIYRFRNLSRDFTSAATRKRISSRFGGSIYETAFDFAGIARLSDCVFF